MDINTIMLGELIQFLYKAILKGGNKKLKKLLVNYLETLSSVEKEYIRNVLGIEWRDKNDDRS